MTKRKQLTANHHDYFSHFAQNSFIGLVLISIALFIGMLGYHFLEDMSWVDAFLNASMILSGMGPMGPLNTVHGKVFAGFYALFSGLMFIMIMGLIFAPVVHRFIKKIHLEADEENKD